MDIFIILIGDNGFMVYSYVKTHQIVLFIYMQFTVCHLYLTECKKMKGDPVFTSEIYQNETEW